MTDVCFRGLDRPVSVHFTCLDRSFHVLLVFSVLQRPVNKSTRKGYSCHPRMKKEKDRLLPRERYERDGTPKRENELERKHTLKGTRYKETSGDPVTTRWKYKGKPFKSLK